MCLMKDNPEGTVTGTFGNKWSGKGLIIKGHSNVQTRTAELVKPAGGQGP